MVDIILIGQGRHNLVTMLETLKTHALQRMEDKSYENSKICTSKSDRPYECIVMRMIQYGGMQTLVGD
jgi:hypothetical protein